MVGALGRYLNIAIPIERTSGERERRYKDIRLRSYAGGRIGDRSILIEGIRIGWAKTCIDTRVIQYLCRTAPILQRIA